MATVDSVMQQLRAKGKEKTRATYARHGMGRERVLGVSVADLKDMAKGLKGQQELGYSLYSTGMMEAMYLAGMLVNGAKMTREKLQEWAEGAGELQMISEYTVPWVTVEHPDAWKLAKVWTASQPENMIASGWTTYSGLVAILPDEDLDMAEIRRLLAQVQRGIGKAQGRAKYTMNGFLLSVGCHVTPLSNEAKEVAREIGTVEVDMGDTACKVPEAVAYIEKVEGMGRLGRKRKTLRC